MQRAPHPCLNGLVRQVWLSTPCASPAAAAAPGASHELMMPTGDMHLVLRLSGAPLELLDSRSGESNTTRQNLGHAVVGGARAASYLKAWSPPGETIGVQLRAGAAYSLFGLPADELAGRHVRLDALWGADAHALREQLQATPTAGAKLRCLEHFLLRRWQADPALRSGGPLPAVLAGLQQLQAGRSVDEAARHAGYSQRQFARLFSQAVGLPPRLYARVQRFQKALGLLHGGALSARLADVAADAGYSDQPHFNRDFLEMSGLTPAQYRAARPAAAHHVPLRLAAGGDVRFVQDRRLPAADNAGSGVHRT
ncbi:MAG: AraC family transcriptional regulator [Haliea sp.]|nr:MAG: AraC family transcriptional regulator [Haliea sp.]